MPENLIDILNRHLDDYAAKPHGDGTSGIVFFIPYKPYKDIPGKLFLDAYYKASDETYRKTIEIIDVLNAAGYKAERDNRHIMKEFAAAAGLCSTAMNTLVSGGISGTRIVLGLIRIDGDYEIKYNKPLNPCLSCGLCAKACPTDAISASGFKRNLCLRQMQDKPENCADEHLALMGNKLWGCEECQKACPLNAGANTSEAEPELISMLDPLTFIEMAIQGKKGLQPFAKYIGANYLRPERLLKLALNAAYNMGVEGLDRIAANLAGRPEDWIKAASKGFLKKYKI